MNEAGEGREIVDVEVVGFVEHQVAAHQAQHGCDLPATALALGGRDQVIDGADEQRCGEQLVDPWIV